MPFEYFEPSTVAEASALAGREAGAASFIAGGTDLVIQMRRGHRRPARVINLHGIGGLDGIALAPEKVALGALTTHRTIERCAAFETALRGLIESAEVIGGHQVRNVATVGGNLCNASPAADLLPILLTLDATVHLSGLDGVREMVVHDFLQGPGRTARRPGEVLTAVSFSPPPARTATAFIKIGRRRAMEISIASIAARLTVDARGDCADIRLAAGAVAPTAIRLHAAERLLRGRKITAEALAAAGRAAAGATSPLSDVRASAAYRRHLVEVATPRAVQRCLERIDG